MFALGVNGYAADSGVNCAANNCKKGDIVLVVSTDTEPAAACPTKAVARYVSYVFAFASDTGKLEDQMDGIFAMTRDKLRSDAKVSSFREAASSCWKFPSGSEVTILEVESDPDLIRVAPVDGSAPYWTIVYAVHLIRKPRQ